MTSLARGRKQGYIDFKLPKIFKFVMTSLARGRKQYALV